MKPSATVHGNTDLHAHLMADPPRKIADPGKRSINAGRGDLKGVFPRHRVMRLQQRRNPTRQSRTIVNAHSAPGPLGHDLKYRSSGARHPNAYDFEAKPGSDRLDHLQHPSLYFALRTHAKIDSRLVRAETRPGMRSGGPVSRAAVANAFS
jgi:hypothetical protein